MAAASARDLDHSPIPATVVDRLAKVCALLGSDQGGERSAAAFQASKILRQHKLTWRELVEAAGPRQPIVTVEDEPAGSPGPADWRAMLRGCQDNAHRLTPWERQFCAALARWRGRPSPKQLAVLARLFERVAS